MFSLVVSCGILLVVEVCLMMRVLFRWCRFLLSMCSVLRMNFMCWLVWGRVLRMLWFSMKV